jgi:hypothetical protein
MPKPSLFKLKKLIKIIVLLLKDTIKMKFTTKNIDSPIVISWFNKIIDISKKIRNNWFTIQGEFVYKYVLPCYYFGYDYAKFSSFKKVVEYYNSIEINTITIVNMNDYEENDIHKIYDHLELNQYNLYISDESHNNSKCELKIESKKNSYITTFKFITKEYLKTISVCVLDLIIYAKMGLVLYDYQNPIIVHWAINTVPKLKIQELNFEENKDILSIINIHDTVVNYIIDLFVIEKQTIWIADISLNISEVSIIQKIKKLKKEGITLLKNEYSMVYITDKEYDTDCSICMEPMKNIICTLSCGHSYDYECIRSWIYIDKELGYKRQNPTCPYCRKLIM